MKMYGKPYNIINGRVTYLNADSTSLNKKEQMYRNGINPSPKVIIVPKMLAALFVKASILKA